MAPTHRGCALVSVTDHHHRQLLSADHFHHGLIGDNVNPLLDPNGLQNNGGPTQTIALQPNSPAIAAIPIAHQCPATDQRGDPRPNPEGPATACDIGAFEYQGVVPTPTSTATATATPISEKLTFSPASLAFGSKVTVGTTSKPKTVTIKNAGSKKTGLAVNIEMESASPPVFAVTSECEETLMPGKSCKASVTFKPADTTPQSGSLMIFDNVAGAPQSVGLSGTGKPAK
jgi:hypothetical protein